MLLTSVWMEGRACPLAQRGHSRDGKKGKLQSAFCATGTGVGAGVPRQHPATVSSQIATLRERFSFAKVVLVGDRGMLTEARIREEVKPAGLDWISALRGPAIRSLVEAGDIEMSLFDERDLVEITSNAYPGERLCRNPLLDRARKRQELLEATEARTDCRSDTARQAPGRSGSGRSSAGWRSTSRGPSTMTVSSPMGAMRLRSLPRPGSTVSTWSAPACRRASSTVPARCAPTSG